MAGASKRKRPTEPEPPSKESAIQALSESGPIPLRSRKIRFNSNSPPPEIQSLAKDEATEPGNDDPESEDPEEEEDDDAAPESISLSAAQARSRAADADVARAAQARKEAAKERRRQRDARLKEQASRAKRVKVERHGEEDDEEAEDGKNGLPTFLPESLLESIPAVRPPTPPLDQEVEGSLGGGEVRRIRHVYKGIVKLPSDKPARDLQIGSLNVSVLEDRNELLPPKSDMKARATRENWLRGRNTMEGKKGRKAGKMERRPFGKARVAFA